MTAEELLRALCPDPPKGEWERADALLRRALKFPENREKLLVLIHEYEQTIEATMAGQPLAAMLAEAERERDEARVELIALQKRVLEAGGLESQLAEARRERNEAQSALAAALERAEQLEAGCDDLNASFDLRWKADQRAIERWQKATGRSRVWPDHADLCVWLMEQLEGAEARQQVVLASIESLAALERGWNSYDAAPITAAARRTARWLVETPPHIVPRSEGGIQLEWHGEVDLEIAIEPDGGIEDSGDSAPAQATAINALEAAAKNDAHDSQVNALEAIGRRQAVRSGK